jgi:hypothetical protein
LAIPSATRSSLNGLRRQHLMIPTIPLFEFSLRLEPSPTIPSRLCRSEAGSSHGLCLPTAHKGTKVHFTRVLPARYVPPSGFGYPLDGLLPSNPCRPCFVPTALLGFSPSERFPLERYPAVSDRKHPHTVSPGVLPDAEASDRPAEPRFLGFDPSESPSRPATLLTHPPLEAPLGFFPSRVCQ